MIVREAEELSGIELMRAAVAYFNGCRESNQDDYTPAELIRFYQAVVACEWTFSSDEWTQEQRDAAAKHGIVPTFEEHDDELTGGSL